MLDERIPNLDVDPHGSIFLGEKKTRPDFAGLKFLKRGHEHFLRFFYFILS